MKEHSLHSTIKRWYFRPGDKLEVRVGRFIVDIVRGSLLIEIQTSNFSAVKSKLTALLDQHPVRLVYPIPQRKWIAYVTPSGELIRRRKSPRKGRLVDLFYELVRTPHLVNKTNFTLDVLMIDEEEVRCNDGQGSWKRRGVSIKDRRLLKIHSTTHFEDETDFRKFLPHDLPTPFTNRTLAKLSDVPITLARKITYCLRRMSVLTTVGKHRSELVFAIT